MQQAKLLKTSKLDQVPNTIVAILRPGNAKTENMYLRKPFEKSMNSIRTSNLHSIKK